MMRLLRRLLSLFNRCQAEDAGGIPHAERLVASGAITVNPKRLR